MKSAMLRRYQSGATGTFGKISFGDIERVTLERPDLNNAPSISCIPAGRYRCRWTYSNRFKRMMYLVDAVPGRSGIRFHAANWYDQLEGCIAVGGEHGNVSGREGISGSKNAIAELEAWGAGEDFHLDVVDEYLEAGDPGQGLG